MEIKLFTNQHAKKYIAKMIKNNALEPEFYSFVVNGWLTETRDVKCYSLSNQNDVINIILLHKCDYDPQKQHKIPYVLDYIYTFLEFRRTNFAYKMLMYLKKGRK